MRSVGRRIWTASWATVSVLLLVLLWRMLPIPPLRPDLALRLPLFLWPLALLLAVLFGRSSLFFSALLTGLLWLSYLPAVAERYLPAPSLPGTTLFPLLLLAVIILGGRGVFSESALPAWIALILFPLCYLLWAQGPPDWGADLFSYLRDPAVSLGPLRLTPVVLLYSGVFCAIWIRAFILGRPSAGVAASVLVVAYLAQIQTETEGAAIPVAWLALPLLAQGALLAEAYSLAYIDGLTRLPGRRALEGDARQLGKQCAVAMIDIDHFKQFNDTHGHHVGDQVLRMVAGRLASVRNGGKAYRYGGEEFTILFRHAEVDAIREELETVRKAVGERPFTLRDSSRPADGEGRKWRGWGASRQQATVTVSVGFSIREKDDRNVEEVRKRADEALYKAKKRGRNRVVSA